MWTGSRSAPRPNRRYKGPFVQTHEGTTGGTVPGHLRHRTTQRPHPVLTVREEDHGCSLRKPGRGLNVDVPSCGKEGTPKHRGSPDSESKDGSRERSTSHPSPNLVTHNPSSPSRSRRRRVSGTFSGEGTKTTERSLTPWRNRSRNLHTGCLQGELLDGVGQCEPQCNSLNRKYPLPHPPTTIFEVWPVTGLTQSFSREVSVAPPVVPTSLEW